MSAASMKNTVQLPQVPDLFPATKPLIEPRFLIDTQDKEKFTDDDSLAPGTMPEFTAEMSSKEPSLDIQRKKIFEMLGKLTPQRVNADGEVKGIKQIIKHVEFYFASFETLIVILDCDENFISESVSKHEELVEYLIQFVEDKKCITEEFIRYIKFWFWNDFKNTDKNYIAAVTDHFVNE